jgi:murein DD-endopeptidase MepM/ murein hydrolase activator NlpD
LKKSLLLKTLIALAIVLTLLAQSTAPAGLAQTETPPPAPAQGPEYIVQEGDSLWSIALRFRVSISDLTAANAMTDANNLNVGDRIIIPGLSGMQGVLTTQEVAFGDTLRSLSRRYQAPIETLVKLNHLTSQAELYAGASLVILSNDAAPAAETRSVLAPGQSLLELAVLQGANPWAYALNNGLPGPAQALPGDVLRLPGGSSTGESPGPGALPDAITGVTLRPQPFIQGGTVVIQIAGSEGMHLGGSLNERPLNIFPDPAAGGYVGLQGIHALAEPGLYPLVISGTLPGGANFAFSQSVFVDSGNYAFDPVLTVSPETIDPAVTAPEDAEWFALTAPVTPERLWSGQFQSPAPPPYSDCWPSFFGNRRSYNGSAYTYFHSGLDFCGGVGAEILAPAAGVVVFAGPLTVRGNATVINHGQGVYTGYLHQSEILVQVGDTVAPGQVIGKVGGTGRVTGPHLHWEVWAGGVQVDPMDWLLNTYPIQPVSEQP